MNTNTLRQLFTFQSIFDGLEDAVICHDLELIITNWNPAAERMFGYTSYDALDENILFLVPEDKYNEQSVIINSLLEGKRTAGISTIRLSKDSNAIPVSITFSAISDEEGIVIGVSQIIRNIADEQRAQREQAILAAIIEGSEDAIVSKNLDGIITTWNKGAESIFGYSAEEAIGQHISLLIPQERLDEEAHIIENIKQGRKVDHYHTIRLRQDGTPLDISLTISPIRNKEGIVIGASKVARDITDRRKAESALEQHAKKLAILNSIGKSISERLDVNLILQKVTDATTDLTGAAFGAFFYNKVNSEGESYMLYTLSGVPREAFSKFPMPRNTAVFHATFSGEGVVRVDDITKDPRYGQNDPYFGMPKGHLPVVSYLAVPVISSSGSVNGGLFFGHPEPGRFLAEHEDLVVNVASQAAIALDNSKLFEEVSELSQKKDEFIALASHELKTPLTSMNGFLQIAQRITPEGAGRNFIEKSIRQLDKLNTLVSDLFDISKIKAGKLEFHVEELDLSALIVEICDALAQTITPHQIDLGMNPGLVVMGDRIRLEQVITNLINNAAKYAPNAPEIKVIAEKNKDGEVVVAVKDYGPGINKENQSRIFGQFYRIQNHQRPVSGLGLGLYITREIIERHGGRIWVESEEGKGATFSFSLPSSLA